MEVVVKGAPKIEVSFNTDLGLRNKADKQGVYPDLIAGDLAGRGESVPAEFSFRASGGKSIKDGRAYIKRIKGNSVVWNQWAKSFEEAYEKPYNDDDIIYNGNKVTIDNWRSYQPFRFDIKCSTAKDHLYLVLLNYANTNPDQLIYIEFGGENSIDKKVGNIAYFHRNIIYNNDYKDAFTLYLAETLEGTITLSDLQVIDLTKMFGAGNEPTTIEDFNARVATLGIDMYAYNEGEVIHCNTESIKSVGDNAWDEEWEIGGIDGINGESFDTDNIIRSKDYNRIIGGQEYSFLSAQTGILILYDEHYNYVDYWNITEGQLRVLAIADNAAYFKICIYDYTYKNGTMLRLNHSGWKSDTGVGYEPYWQDTLPLPIIRKYFPDGMKSAGSAHDEIRFNKASGKWEYSKGRIKEVDMANLGWYNDASLGGFYSDALVGAKKLFDGICAKYPFVGDYRNVTDKTCGYVYELHVLVKDSSYTDAESFKASLQGVMLYYESNDWEWVELDAEDQNFRDYYQVADFGTEQSQSAVPSAAFSADIIYQFNAVDMIREHEMEITELQKVIATMQAQLTSLTNGGQ